MAVGICVPGIPGEDASLPGCPGQDIVQGAAAGDVLDPGPVHLALLDHVMGTLPVPVARVVEVLELDQDPPDGFPHVLAVGAVVDDDHVQVGLAVPAASSPRAEKDDGPHVTCGRQVPAEIKSGRVGTRVGHGRQMVADAVSSHRRHGTVTGRRRCLRADCRWLLTVVMECCCPGIMSQFGWKAKMSAWLVGDGGGVA